MAEARAGRSRMRVCGDAVAWDRLWGIGRADVVGIAPVAAVWRWDSGILNRTRGASWPMAGVGGLRIVGFPERSS